MISTVVTLIVIGGVSGLAGGLFGIGGSVVTIPAMTEALGPNQHVYQAAAMIVNFFVATPAVLHHYTVGAIDRAMIRRLIPLAALSVLAGVGLSELPLFHDAGEAKLRGLFGGFLLFLSLYELLRSGSRGRAATLPPVVETADATVSAGNGGGGVPPRWTFASMVAIPSGLIAGALGVGGGLLAVPLQKRFLGVPIRTAIANSSAVIIATSAVGAVAKNYACYVESGGSLEPFVLAAVLIPSAAAGSMLGSRLVHRVPVQVLRISFFLLLLAASIRLVYTASRDIGLV